MQLMIRSVNKNFFIILILLILGLFTRIIFIWHPNELVFDEVYFGKFPSYYFNNQYYFDIHPPLGKLLIAGFIKLFKIDLEFNFEKIGETYYNNQYIYLRFLPNFFGGLIPLFLFLFLLELGFSKKASFLAAWMILFDNAYLAQSHYILIDSLLICFGLIGLYLFFKSKNKNYDLKFLFLSSLFLTFSFSIKWTGLGFYSFIFFILIKDLIDGIIKNNKKIIYILLIFIIIPFLIYFLIFYIHFSLLFLDGPGNIYMKSDFMNKNVFEKFIELNKEMFNANKRITSSHPFSSKAWQWPLMIKPIYFWTDNQQSKIYLLGNPVVWIFASLITLLSFIFYNKKFHDYKQNILYLGYFTNYLPFFFIQRPMFLYHYLPSLLFAVSIFCYLFFNNQKMNNKIYLSLLIIIFILFIFLTPLSYGLPLNNQILKYLFNQTKLINWIL